MSYFSLDNIDRLIDELETKGAEYSFPGDPLFLQIPTVSFKSFKDFIHTSCWKWTYLADTVYIINAKGRVLCFKDLRENRQDRYFNIDKLLTIEEMLTHNQDLIKEWGMAFFRRRENGMLQK